MTLCRQSSQCKRRRILTYRVREDIQRLVLLNLWKSGVCAACFDERWREGMQYAGQTPAMPTPDALIFASYRSAPRRWRTDRSSSSPQ